MPVSREDVLNYLGREEPPYLAAAGLGPEAIPHLMAIVRGTDAGLASKAVSLAGHIETGEEVVATGLRHPMLAVRISSAAAIRHVREDSTKLLHEALTDPAPQVRKWGLMAVSQRPDSEVREAIERIATDDPDRLIRAAARKLVGEPRETSD
jgi:HEAT repeat protein